VTYSWHRDSGSVPSRSRGQDSNTLTIHRAIPPDEGIYYCMASKEGISVESNRARVRVNGKKSIIIINIIDSDAHTGDFLFTKYLNYFQIYSWEL